MRIRWVLLAFVVAVSSAGCMAPLSRSYVPAGAISSGPRIDELIVSRPTEGRPDGGNPRIWTAWPAIIPFVPHGEQRFTPDWYWTSMRGATGSPYDFGKDLGETIAKDLQAAGIATKVTYVDQPQLPPQRRTGKVHFLDLTLKEGWWHRHPTAYGLSLPGVLLYLVGLPFSYGYMTLAVEAELKDAEGKRIAQRQLEGRARAVDSLYYRPVAFPSILRNAYGKLSGGLRQFVLENLPK